MKESQKKGSPFTRALMLHYPNDSKARSTNNEFMLGENILMGDPQMLDSFLGCIHVDASKHIEGTSNFVNAQRDGM